MPLYSYSYSLPYVILILILFYLSYRESKARPLKKDLIINFASVILVFFFGLRGFIQSDFQNYYPWFQELPTFWSHNFFMAFVENYEPGFVLFSILCKSILPNYFCWIFISSLIDILLLKKIFKDYSYNVCLSFAIFTAIGAVIMEFNLMRNVKAILILILALKYIRTKSLVKYLICILLATLFHITSIIFLPLYFILDKRWPKSVLLGIFTICVAVLFLRIKFLSSILPSVASILGGEYAALTEFYFASGALDASYGISIGFIERAITFFLVFTYYDKWIDKLGGRYMFPNLFIIYFMCFALLTEMAVLLERFAYFFALSYCIFYPNLLNVIRRKSNRFLLITFIVLIFTLKMAQQTRTIVCKYDNVLFGIESFEARLSTLELYNTSI